MELIEKFPTASVEVPESVHQSKRTIVALRVYVLGKD
jgi:hypothetical protein